MPEISRFFGIVIYMYFKDHAPPHFHVRYGKQVGIVDIETGGVLRGRLSPRALGMIAERAAAHREELRENWRRARAHEALLPVEPLE
jgi:hypothetical protein